MPHTEGTWKFDKTISVGHLLILLGGLSSGLGMYYATQAKIAENKAAITLLDQSVRTVSGNQVRIMAALELLDREQGEQNVAIERLKVKVGG